MADIFSKKKRSNIMSRIRSKGTAPEARLRQIVKGLAGRRKIVQHEKVAGVSVDLYVPSLKAAVFCDGCFYHVCPQHGHVPKSNKKYWAPKLAKNKARDVKLRRELRRRGYAVWRVWEHALVPGRVKFTTGRLKMLIADRKSELGV